MRRIRPPAYAMEITQQVRNYAAAQDMDAEEAVESGLAQKSEEFREQGCEIYSEA